MAGQLDERVIEAGLLDAQVERTRMRPLASGELPVWQAVRNRLIGRVRQAIERTFSQLKGRYRLTRMRYAGLHANAFHLDLIAIAYNLRTLAARA